MYLLFGIILIVFCFVGWTKQRNARNKFIKTGDAKHLAELIEQTGKEPVNFILFVFGGLLIAGYFGLLGG